MAALTLGWPASTSWMLWSVGWGWGGWRWWRLFLGGGGWVLRMCRLIRGCLVSGLGSWWVMWGCGLWWRAGRSWRLSVGVLVGVLVCGWWRWMILRLRWRRWLRLCR